MEYEFLCKTFRCCIDEDCDNCPLYDFEIEHCEKQIKLQALSFIIRQQADKERLEIELQKAKAEIEDLKADKEAIINGQLTLQKMYLESRAKAVREFAERLKSRIRKDIDEQGMFPLPYTKKAYDTVMIFINNLAKEMTEKEGGKG